MRSYWLSPRMLTNGERSVMLSYIIMALSGGGLAFSVVNNLDNNSEILRQMSAYDLWMIVSGMLGSMIALYSCRRWLGHSGRKGYVNAAFAIPLFSLTAALVTGTLVLPVFGTMFGPLALAGTLYEHPLLALFWIISLMSVHYLFTIYRAERDSIFQDKRIKTDEVLA